GSGRSATIRPGPATSRRAPGRSDRIRGLNGLAARSGPCDVRPMPPRSLSPHHVAMVAYPGANAVDVIGPLEVFSTAAALAGRTSGEAPPYSTEIVAVATGPVETQSGIHLVATRALAAIRGAVDTLLVAGGLGTQTALGNRALLAALRRLAPRARRLGSVCSGSFLLAAAGLLDGRRATTHWMWCETLAERFPRVRVERDPIFVRDGNVWTSAGVTAGMELPPPPLGGDLGRRPPAPAARPKGVFFPPPRGPAPPAPPLPPPGPP